MNKHKRLTVKIIVILTFPLWLVPVLLWLFICQPISEEIDHWFDKREIK